MRRNDIIADRQSHSHTDLFSEHKRLKEARRDVVGESRAIMRSE